MPAPSVPVTCSHSRPSCCSRTTPESSISDTSAAGTEPLSGTVRQLDAWWCQGELSRDYRGGCEGVSWHWPVESPRDGDRTLALMLNVRSLSQASERGTTDVVLRSISNEEDDTCAHTLVIEISPSSRGRRRRRVL